MGRRPTKWIALAFALLAAGSALAVEQKGTRVETARWAAGLNARSQAGREWMNQNSATIARLLVPVLNKCVPDTGDELTAFSLYVRLSRKGRVSEVVTDLDVSLGRCITSGAGEVQLPEAPRDDYWIQVNLAASL